MLRALVIAALTSALAAPGAASARIATGRYVAALPGGHAFIAIVSDGKRAGGYVCDGAATSVWLRPAAERHGRVPLRSRAGRTLGHASIAHGAATGSVLVGGRRLAFHARRARGTAGLYRAAGHNADQSVEYGWILLPDGRQRGSRTAQVRDGTSNTVRAPTLDPSSSAVKDPVLGDLAVQPITSGIIAILIG